MKYILVEYYENWKDDLDDWLSEFGRNPANFCLFFPLLLIVTIVLLPFVPIMLPIHFLIFWRTNK